MGIDCSIGRYAQEIFLFLYTFGGFILSVTAIVFISFGYDLVEYPILSIMTGLFMIPFIGILSACIFRQRAIRNSSIFRQVYMSIHQREFYTCIILTVTGLYLAALIVSFNQLIGILFDMVILHKPFYPSIQTFGIGSGITLLGAFICVGMIKISHWIKKCYRLGYDNVPSE